MVIDIKPETEQLLKHELSIGHFRSVDEIIVRGIHSRRLGRPIASEPPVRTAAEAVAHIRSARIGNQLPAGTSVRDLIDEGRD